MRSDRSRPEVHPGQGHRQLDLAEGRRRAVQAPGQAGQALRRGGGRDGVRRKRPGRHLCERKTEICERAYRSAGRRASAFRQRTSFSTRTSSRSPPASKSTATTASTSSNATRWIKAEPAVRQGQRRCLERERSRSAATTRCAKPSTPCSCTTPSGRHGRWASSTPAWSVSTTTLRPRLRERVEDVRASIAGPTRPNALIEFAEQRSRAGGEKVEQTLEDLALAPEQAALERAPDHTRWCTASPTTSSTTPKRSTRQDAGERAGGRPIQRDRGPADGRHERRRRPVRRRARCSCRRW